MRPDLEAELLIWRPIMARRCTLEEVKAGVYTLADLQKMNALLEMQADIKDQIIEDNTPKQKGGGR